MVILETAPEVLMGTLSKKQDHVVLTTSQGEFEYHEPDMGNRGTVKVTGAIKEVEGPAKSSR